MFKRILEDRARVHEAYRSVFTSAEGQVVLRHMLKKFNMSSPSFVQGDPHMTSFKEGQRHVVLSIMKFINKNADQIAEQIKEHIDDE